MTVANTAPVLAPTNPSPAQEVLPLLPGVPPGTKALDLLALHVPSFSSLPKEKQKVIIEYVRRLHKPELLKVLTEIEKLPPLYEAELEAIRTLDTAHPIFQNPSLQEHAFKAFVSGSLTVDEVSQLFIHDICVHTPGTLVKSIAQGGYHLTEGTQLSLFKEEIEQFLDNPQLQESKIYFVKINPENNIVWKIRASGYYFLTIYLNPWEGDCYQIVLTPQLLSLLLNKKHPHQEALVFNPVLGPSVSCENFQNPHRRDLLVPCRLFPDSQPKEADGMPANPLEFWYHDTAYHGLLLSRNPRRQAMIDLANLFQEKESSVQRFRGLLLDQEVPGYAHKFPVSFHFFEAVQKYWNASFKDEDPQKQRVAKRIWDHIEAHKERWEKIYLLDDLNFKSLFRLSDSSSI